jgi:hypothetical protein
MKLSNLHENIGILTQVKHQNGMYELTFVTENKIELPEDAVDGKILDVLIGRRIGIIHLNGNYNIRIIKEV